MKIDRLALTVNNTLASSVCIFQLLADHSRISAVPEVITHCPPLVIDAYLHSTLILIGASHQTNITVSTVATCINCKWSILSTQPDQKNGTHSIQTIHTLTSHSSIFTMAIAVTADKRTPWTINEVPFTAITANALQVDRTSTSTEVSIAKGHCICLHQHISVYTEIIKFSSRCAC